MGQSESLRAETDLFDIVFDLNNTIIFVDFMGVPDLEVCNPSLKKMVPFRVAHGTYQVLEALYNIPNTRISFYSAGESWRNKELIPKLLKKVPIKHARRKRPIILSKDQLNNAGKKDLTFISPKLSLPRAILVDDQDTAAKGQEGNLLRLFPGMAAHSSPSLTQLEIFCIKNNLLRILGILLQVITEVRKSSCNVAEVLSSVLAKEQLPDSKLSIPRQSAS